MFNSILNLKFQIIFQNIKIYLKSTRTNKYSKLFPNF